MSWLDKFFGNATSLQGVPLSSVPPTLGQSLVFNGFSWVPAPIVAGGFTSVRNLVAGGSAQVGTDAAPLILCSPGGGGSGECDVTAPAVPVAGPIWEVRVDETADATHIALIKDATHPLQIPGVTPTYTVPPASVTLNGPGNAASWTWDPSSRRWVIA